MEIDDGLTVTEAQWREHSEAWRLAHLNRAPSAILRQQALSGQELTSDPGASPGHSWTSLPHLGVEMMVAAAIVAVIVIAVAFR